MLISVIVTHPDNFMPSINSSLSSFVGPSGDRAGKVLLFSSLHQTINIKNHGYIAVPLDCVS